MENILEYRGKTLKTKQWVVGNLITNPECEHYMIGTMVSDGGNSFDEPPSDHYEAFDIDKKTIGLVSDLKENNTGINVACGDIINNGVNKKYKVVFKNFSFYFIALSDNQKYNFEQYLKMLKKAGLSFKIIGNIIDNKELLKN